MDGDYLNRTLFVQEKLPIGKRKIVSLTAKYIANRENIKDSILIESMEIVLVAMYRPILSVMDML